MHVEENNNILEGVVDMFGIQNKKARGALEENMVLAIPIPMIT